MTHPKDTPATSGSADQAVIEIWKPVSGYNMAYEISSLGNIRSEKGLLNPMPNTKGYLRVGLRIGKKSSYKSIHSLVAAAFIGERPVGYHIEHINHDKRDNRPENLRYCTPKENVGRNKKDGRLPLGVDHHLTTLTEEQVRHIKTKSLSQTKFGKLYNVDQTTVGRIQKGISWSHVE